MTHRHFPKKKKSGWCRFTLKWQFVSTGKVATVLVVYFIWSLSSASLGNIFIFNNYTRLEHPSKHWSLSNANRPRHIKQREPEISREIQPHNFQNGKTALVEKFATPEEVPVVKVVGGECDKLMQGNQEAIFRAISYQRHNRMMPKPAAGYAISTVDCEVFRQQRNYITKPVSQEEADFPIAFSILMYKDVGMFERLLRAIYRPQNYYCVHVDQKAKSHTLKGVQGIVRCFDNVFVASKLSKVVWGTYSVLEPEITCMEDLWAYRTWKYFINLTGQEFPLKTNLDLVRILKAFNGANNVGATRRFSETRFFVHKGRRKTRRRKGAPPGNVTLTRGPVHVCVTRDYVGYVLHDERALAFRKWVQDTGIPDETFFTSLNHSPQLEVPGAYLGVPETDDAIYPFFVRFKIWKGSKLSRTCNHVQRDICIFSVMELQMLSERPEMFANKFRIDFHPLALDCMEQLHHNRTRDEILGTRVFNATPYGKYDFVKKHV